MISEDLLDKVKQSQAKTHEVAVDVLETRMKEAMTEIDRLIHEFRRRDPALERIVLFGSLAKGVPRNPSFDIDLSFEGRELYACTSIALDSSFKVDLVDYRSLPDFMKEEIDTHGKVLYSTDA